MRSIGEYFEGQTGTQSPRDVKDGIFSAPLGKTSGRGMGEYWEGGSVPDAQAVRDGIFNGPVMGLGRSVGQDTNGSKVPTSAWVKLAVLAGLMGGGGFLAGKAIGRGRDEMTYGLIGLGLGLAPILAEALLIPYKFQAVAAALAQQPQPPVPVLPQYVTYLGTGIGFGLLGAYSLYAK